MRVLFRADAGDDIGLGHVMRCLALAGALGKMGAESVFLGREYLPAVRETIERRGHRTLAAEPGEREPHATLRRMRETSTDVVVVDLYGITEAYLSALREQGVVLVSLDDCNLMPFPSHLVVNPNRFALDMEYRSSTGDTQFLLGPSYCLLREEFAEARDTPRRIAPHGRRLLVSMGGSDLGGLTAKVVRAVAPLELETVVIQGAAAQEPLALDWPNVRVVLSPPNMAEWMLWADAAVTCGGGTIYELAAMGTPGVVLALGPDQQRNAAAMEAEGTLTSLGLGSNASEGMVADAVAALMEDLQRRQAMSRRGQEVVDGKGAERVADAVLRLCQSSGQT